MTSNHTVYEHALEKLHQRARPENLKGMARFGIEVDKALGVRMPDIRKTAREIIKTTGRDHQLADQLWQSEIHEARMLASLVEQPELVTSSQMDDWAADFNSWDLCDQVCGNLFDRLPHTDEKIFAWATRRQEFVRRASFATMAWRAVHDKEADDNVFVPYLLLIENASRDERNFVKKAVNWALRQIGKRSVLLYPPALQLAQKLSRSDNKAAQWIGKDAVRELQSDKVRNRLGL